MIFKDAIPFEQLPDSDTMLKEYLNYNPPQLKYTQKQNMPERDPSMTDRGGWRGYDRVYSQYFKDIRDKKLNILEIGIMHGYGIYAWQKYFSKSTVYGIDIDWSSTKMMQLNDLKKKHNLFKQARLYNLDSTKENSWYQFNLEHFDVIIDDGDHHPDNQIATFKLAWNYLRNGGLYFIEDVGHRYGEIPLQKLSDCLNEYSLHFESLNIYSHNNLGLKRIMQDKNYLNMNKSRIVADTNVNTTEYIVAIKKKKME